MTFSDLLQAQLEELKQEGLFRARLLANDFKKNANFSSNDYLSLRQDPRINRAFEKGFSKFPAGSGASMTVCGYHPAHQSLEKAFCEQLGVDRALLFNSGYAANLGVISLLSRLKCQLLIDKSIHASIYDGINLASATYTRFLHNNLTDLQKKMTSSPDQKVVMTEGIFSMSGQQPNLAKIADICQSNQSVCVVDEAHSFGVLGPQGLGATAFFSLTQKEVPLRIITFGKAMAAQGAIVVGQEDWIEGLYQYARSHIYTTAMSPAMAFGLLEGFAIVSASEDRRKKLTELVSYFQQAIARSPLTWTSSNTPIQQLQLGCPYKAINYAAELKQKGILCQAMRPPTLSLRATGLRVVLNYHHEPQDIDNLFNQLHHIYDHSR